RSRLLASTAVVALQHRAFPSWLGWLSAALALLGLVTPVSFVLLLVFPLWVVAVSVLLSRRP
ncbi:MAG: hypothetical protein M3N47_07570, partial [Chloroflexota bacterium]|nr:hypothetical protein [Chloroflexota bacterium]